MNAAEWATIIEVVFGVIIMLAAAFAVAKANFSKTQIEALRGDRDDLTERVDRLEDENGRLRNENNELRQKVGLLENLVTGREQISELREEIGRHHQEMTRSLRQVHGAIETIADTLGAPS